MEIMPVKYTFEPVISSCWGSDPIEDGNDILCYRTDFDYDSLSTKKNGGIPRNISPEDFKKRALRKGDILIEKSGGGEQTLVGRAALFDKDIQAVCSKFVSVLRPRAGQSSRYWNYQLAALYGSRGILPYLTQSTGIQNLILKAYLSQRVPIRSYEGQERIADELDYRLTEIDGLIADQQRALKLIDEKFISQISELFDAYADGYSPLRRFGLLKESGYSANGIERPAESSSELGTLKTGEISKGYFDPTENKVVNNPIENNKLKTQVKANSPIINRANSPEPVGATVFIDENYPSLYLSDLMWKIKFLNYSHELFFWFSKILYYRYQRFTQELATRCKNKL